MTIKDIHIPDIGGAEDIDVIEVLVSAGDQVAEEDSLLTLESDKASMEIPSPFAGVIKTITLKVGDKVSEGDFVGTLEIVAGQTRASESADKPSQAQTTTQQKTAAPTKTTAPSTPTDLPKPTGVIYAGPSVRRIAREFGVDLRKVGGSGRKGRILKIDVQNYVKAELTKAATGGGLLIAPAPKIDFAKFGPIDIQPLNKIKKLTGANVHRSWVTVPHVTQFGEADITELEAYRQEQKAIAAERGVKLTPLVFIMKAVVASLQALPTVNSSLDATGENLVYKQYYHIGIAVDTPNGLVVPVIRDVDKKDIFVLAEELGAISLKAREKGLTLVEMSGSTFTISSLGGIGGTAFTPIVKAPDVAILGVSRSSMKPVYDGKAFVPRLMLPLSLSYDHRVIDGAEGARFIVDLANRLQEVASLV